jgi:two-component system, NarL family, response regulator DevR
MKSLTVIVVDDHAVVRRGLREVLDRAPGITVVADAGTATRAFASRVSIVPMWPSSTLPCPVQAGPRLRN